MSLPQSTTTRLKKALFRILDLPEDALEYADIHLEHFAHDISIKIKTAYNTDKKEFSEFVKKEQKNIHDLKEQIFGNDKYVSDAIHENSNTHEFTFSVPANVKGELKEISKIQSAEDGVINKNQNVNRLLDKIDEKV